MSRHVNCIPSTDEACAAAARNALDAIDGHAHADAVAELLANVLGGLYPNVVIRRQHELARESGLDVWYAYRDGRPHRGTVNDANQSADDLEGDDVRAWRVLDA